MHKYKLTGSIFFLLCSLVVFAQTGNNKYDIQFDNNLHCKINAELSLEPSDTVLRVSGYGAWNYDEGWAGFIKDLSAFDQNGNTVTLTKNGKHSWRINGKPPGKLSIRYSVDYSYADKPGWKDGPKSTSAFYDGKGLFLNSASLFIYQSEKNQTTVNFSVPAAWKVSTPWQKDGNGNRFHEKTMEPFIKNVIVLGEFPSVNMRVENFNFTIISLGYKSDVLSLIAPAAKKFITDFSKIFKYKDTVTNYVMVWFQDEEWDTGEAYGSSYVIVNPDVPVNQNRLVWSTMMGHEIFHYWLGKLLKAEDYATSQWFSEGFTEYFATRSAIKNKIISPALFQSLMQHRLLLYNKFRFRFGTPYENISLIEAGARKSNYNAAVYDGGYTVALCLDIILTTNSNGKVSLNDFLLAMYDNIGKKTKPYTTADILFYLEQTGGKEAIDFYKKYVEGKDMIPVNKYLTKIGLIAVNGFYVAPNEKAKPDELLFRKSFFGF